MSNHKLSIQLTIARKQAPSSKRYSPTTSKAFTLIELSVVIVIIGLIVAGIVAGQSLVKQAQFRAVISEANSYKVAYNNFKLTYDALPGDFKNASNYWSSTTDGNGNGEILEWYQAWEHLEQAGLINDTVSGIAETSPDTHRIGINFPKGPVNETGWWLRVYPSGTAYSHPVGNVLTLSKIRTGFATNILGGEGFTPAQAQSIDEKIDDGLADSGIFYTIRGSSASVRDEANACVTDKWDQPTSAYVLTDTTARCRIAFWLN